MHVVLVGPEPEENLSLRYLRGALEADGHQVTQLDFDGPDNLERSAATIACSDADVVGLSMVFTRRARQFADLAERCRTLGFRGLCVAGGHFAAFHPEQLLLDVPAIDAVAIGEGEPILRALARSPGDLGSIGGLVWRDGTTLRRNEPAEPVDDLDELPWPTHRRPFDPYLGLPIANLLASRGCTYGGADASAPTTTTTTTATAPTTTATTTGAPVRTATQVREAAPPPPPHHMEAAPRWDPIEPTKLR